MKKAIDDQPLPARESVQVIARALLDRWAPCTHVGECACFSERQLLLYCVGGRHLYASQHEAIERLLKGGAK